MCDGDYGGGGGGTRNQVRTWEHNIDRFGDMHIDGKYHSTYRRQPSGGNMNDNSCFYGIGGTMVFLGLVLLICKIVDAVQFETDVISSVAGAVLLGGAVIAGGLWLICHGVKEDRLYRARETVRQEQLKQKQLRQEQLKQEQLRQEQLRREQLVQVAEAAASVWQILVTPTEDGGYQAQWLAEPPAQAPEESAVPEETAAPEVPEESAAPEPLRSEAELVEELLAKDKARRRRRWKIFAWIVAGLLVLAAAAWIGTDVWVEKQQKADYQAALDCLEHDDYAGAEPYLQAMNDRSWRFYNMQRGGYGARWERNCDAGDLLRYVKLRQIYDPKDPDTYEEANELALWVDEDYDGPYSEVVVPYCQEVFRFTTDFKYDNMPDYPYFGMDESEIDDTWLGYHDDYERVDGINIYYFEKDGEVVRVVTCKDGKVVKSYDPRKSLTVTPRNSYTTDLDHSFGSQRDDYMDEEDFYDYHYDDFADFDEAEMYWTDYGD